MPIKISLLMVLLLLGGCTLKEPTKIDTNRSKSCQDRLKSSIHHLIGAKHLKVSNSVFSKTPYLYLTNKIVGDRRGRKTLLLYKKEDNLYVGLIDSKENIIKEVEVIQCQNNLY